MLKKIIFSLALIFIFIATVYAEDDTLTISTYYPSPYGVFKNMRFYPNDANTPGAACTREGETYFDESESALYICSGTSSLTWRVAPGAGGPSNIGMEVFTSSGTFTPLAGVTKVIVEVVGGGTSLDCSANLDSGGPSSFGSCVSVTAASALDGGEGVGGDINLTGEKGATGGSNLGLGLAGGPYGGHGNYLSTSSRGYGASGIFESSGVVYSAGGAGYAMKLCSVSGPVEVTVGSGGTGGCAGPGVNGDGRGKTGIVVVRY